MRSELVRKARYLQRNSGFVRELVGNMAIYSTGDGIRTQAQSPDPDWNRAAEEYFAAWSASCEVTGRFSFGECQSLVCRGMDIDGEYFILKTRNSAGEPRLQLIESHRIGDRHGAAGTTDGIGLDSTGAPVFYRALEDGGGVRDLPAPSVLHIHEPENASAVRPCPPIQHAINHVLDEMEGQGWHLDGILARRAEVYRAAKARHPERWNGRSTRNWSPVRSTTLNPVSQRSLEPIAKRAA